MIPDLECVDVPKEVCVRVRKNPRVIKKPGIKKWCYTPTSTEGSGFEVTTEFVPLEGTELDQTDVTVPDSVPDTDETAPGPDETAPGLDGTEA